MNYDYKPVGAAYLSDGTTRFRIWAPKPERLSLRIHGEGSNDVPLERDNRGYCELVVPALPGTRYSYVLNGDVERPDPASRYQNDGVHGPSVVVDHRFDWSDDDWPGIPLHELIIYELHVGTFTKEGTFAAIISHLSRLAALGITAIELMPVAQFPGARNWGYDGVLPFAVQSSYGGPDGLKALVDAAHSEGLAVVMDVVYNHLGPEGNYLAEFGPYFTDRYKTPWGMAINFDGPESDEVRNFFISNAILWVDEFHIDALRIDAVHAIADQTAKPFLHDLADAIRQEALALNRIILTIAESDLNDPRLIRSPQAGGYGFDGQWSDDFHHSLHALLTQEKAGYYSAFGRVSDLAAVFRSGYLYTGQYSVYRKRRYGAPPTGVPSYRFVVSAQNHDQIGNRMLGERLSLLVDPAGSRLAAAATLLSPFVPLLFMGEEYGEKAPFLYFTSHSDQSLIEAVRKGRAAEFADFAWKATAPAPDDEKSFTQSILDHDLLVASVPHQQLFAWHRDLIDLRKRLFLDGEFAEVFPFERERVLCTVRTSAGTAIFTILAFNDQTIDLRLPLPSGNWKRVADSNEARWGGSGILQPPALERDGPVVLTLEPFSAVVYLREGD